MSSSKNDEPVTGAIIEEEQGTVTIDDYDELRERYLKEKEEWKNLLRAGKDLKKKLCDRLQKCQDEILAVNKKAFKCMEEHTDDSQQDKVKMEELFFKKLFSVSECCKDHVDGIMREYDLLERYRADIALDDKRKMMNQVEEANLKKEQAFLQHRRANEQLRKIGQDPVGGVQEKFSTALRQANDRLAEEKEKMRIEIDGLKERNSEMEMAMRMKEREYYIAGRI